MEQQKEGRVGTVLNKGFQLHTLCGVDVCVVITDPVSGKLFIYPKNTSEIARIIQRYRISPKSNKRRSYKKRKVHVAPNVAEIGELGAMGFGVNEALEKKIKNEQKEVEVKVEIGIEDQKCEVIEIEYEPEFDLDNFWNEIPQLDHHHPHFTPTGCDYDIWQFCSAV